MNTVFLPTIKTGTKSEINVERYGKPFGQIWTWECTRNEWHPWHAKPLNGDHKTFDNLKEAKAWMENA